MDLSNFVTYDKKESLLLNIAKSNQEFVENTHSKPQKTLEFKMTKQKVDDRSNKFRSIQHCI